MLSSSVPPTTEIACACVVPVFFAVRPSCSCEPLEFKVGFVTPLYQLDRDKLIHGFLHRRQWPRCITVRSCASERGCHGSAFWYSSCPRTRDIIAAELGWRCCESSKIGEEANVESRTASTPAKRYRKTRMPRIRSDLAQAAPRTVLTRRSILSFPKIGKALETADAYFIPASGYRHCLPRCVCRLRGFAPHEPGSGREFRYVTAMRRSF